MSARRLASVALALVAATALSGCVMDLSGTDAAPSVSRTVPTASNDAGTSNHAPTQSRAPVEPYSAEDRFMRDAQTITPQPHLISSVRAEMLAAGYSVCDARREGHSRATIIEVTHYSLGVDRHPDLFYSDAATTLTDSALRNLC